MENDKALPPSDSTIGPGDKIALKIAKKEKAQQERLAAKQPSDGKRKLPPEEAHKVS